MVTRTPLALLFLMNAPCIHAQDLHFGDDFSDNSMGWTFPCTGCSIAGGDYIMDITDDQMYAVWQDGNHPIIGEYSIELGAVHESGTDDYGYGLFFGGSDFDHCFLFAIASGSYRISQYNGPDWEHLVDWTDDDAILKYNGAENILRMAIFNGELHFYANGEFLTRMILPRIPSGTKVGMYASNAQKVRFTYIAVLPEGEPPVRILPLCAAVKQVLAHVGEFGGLKGKEVKENSHVATIQVDGAYTPKIVTGDDGLEWMAPMGFIPANDGSVELRYLDSLAAILKPCLTDQQLVREAGWLGSFAHEYRSYLPTDEGFAGPLLRLYAFDLIDRDSSVIYATVRSPYFPLIWRPVGGAADRNTPLGRSIEQVFVQFPKGFDAWEGAEVEGMGLTADHQSTFEVAGSSRGLVKEGLLSSNKELEFVMAQPASFEEGVAPWNELIDQVSRTLGEGYYVATMDGGSYRKAEFRRFGESGFTVPVVDVILNTEDGGYPVKLRFGAEGDMY